MKNNKEFYEIIKMLSTIQEKDKLKLLTYLRSLQGNEDNLKPASSVLRKD